VIIEIVICSSTYYLADMNKEAQGLRTWSLMT